MFILAVITILVFIWRYSFYINNKDIKDKKRPLLYKIGLAYSLASLITIIATIGIGTVVGELVREIGVGALIIAVNITVIFITLMCMYYIIDRIKSEKKLIFHKIGLSFVYSIVITGGFLLWIVSTNFIEAEIYEFVISASASIIFTILLSTYFIIDETKK